MMIRSVRSSPILGDHHDVKLTLLLTIKHGCCTNQTRLGIDLELLVIINLLHTVAHLKTDKSLRMNILYILAYKPISYISHPLTLLFESRC